jgi:hypothetical protein
LTAYAPLRLAGHLSARQRSWDFTLRSFPRTTGGPTLPRRCRTCMPLPDGSTPPARSKEPTPPTPTSRLSPRRASLAHPPVIHRGRTGCSLGLHTLQGSTTAEHARRISPPSSPHALPRRQAAPAPQGLDAHAADPTHTPQPEGQRRATQTTLMGFARRRHPQSSRRTRSGLMGSPHERRAVTGLPCPVPRTTHAALPQPLAWR